MALVSGDDRMGVLERQVNETVTRCPTGNASFLLAVPLAARRPVPDRT